MDLMNSAISLLSWSEKRLEVSSHNISNMASHGFKANVAFQTMLETDIPGALGLPVAQQATDFTAGKISRTESPYDIAIGGTGFFQIRSGDDIRYTRDGHFTRDGDGRLVDGAGFALQADGGDLVLRGNSIQILADGTVLDDGEPVARLMIKDFEQKVALLPVGGNAFSALSAADPVDVVRPDLQQGALETSNVSNEHEMMAMMAAIRSAEMGQRTVQLYDELMGRAADSFSGRG